MGEFSAQWLSLREPIDHAARSSLVRDTMLADLRVHHGNALAGLRLLDLGCGSGSNLRAIAPLLGDQQHWTLVDYDEALLAAARATLKSWAHEVRSEQSDSMRVLYAGLQLDIRFQVADLSRDLESVLSGSVDLVTAAALFDLVSRDWVDRFCEVLAAPVYAVLSFDGQMTWSPEHALDRAVSDAFSAHQGIDKGFGAALGPESGTYLSQALQDQGFDVVLDKSPWQINDLPSDFHDMLIDGIALAVSEVGVFSSAQLDSWLAATRLAHRCVIGHDDLYASKRELR